MDYVIATTTSFFDMPNEQTVFVTAGERWAKDSALVRKYPGSFADPGEDDIRGVERAVESATAAPGEKRATVRTK
jgi:hypothetical protein